MIEICLKNFIGFFLLLQKQEAYIVWLFVIWKVTFLLINDSQYIFLHFGIFDINNSNIHFAKLIQAQVSTLLAQLNRKNRFVFGIEIDNCFMRLYIIYNSLGQILSVWYYHVTVILCITHTHYVVFRTKCAVFVQR